ncbi:MAG: sigma-70 family RNA polymerase sigma factor [Anaerolineae bacterium]|nr:MAG: sigma-70 family RNA polymerase sigma factor [Anaerolineae bacterium]
MAQNADAYNNRDAREEEARLVERAKTDADAFGELYSRYVKASYNYVYYRTGNHHEAEDLTARVFHRALRHIQNYTDRGVPFSAWLYRIAHNLVANWHRDQSRRKFVALDDFYPFELHGEAPEGLAERREEKELLLEAIRDLPDDRLQLLILKFVERLSNAEIGEIMNRSEGAIKSLYHRTLVALREDLTARTDDGAAGSPKRRRWRRRSGD